MLAPVAAWFAICGRVEWPPVVLGMAVLFWVAGFDIIYACQDVEIDRRTGLWSVPARWGLTAALRVAALCHAAMLAALLALPMVFPLGMLYLTGIAAVAAMLIYEHLLVRPDDLTRVNLAFFHLNSIISVGLLVVGVVDLML